jgi:hypothetical protein
VNDDIYPISPLAAIIVKGVYIANVKNSQEKYRYLRVFFAQQNNILKAVQRIRDIECQYLALLSG